MKKWVLCWVSLVMILAGSVRAEIYKVYCPNNTGQSNFVDGQQWQRIMKGLQNNSDALLRIGNNTFANGPNRSLLRFRLDAIPAQAAIRRATLWLDGYDAWDTAAMSLRVHRIIGPWNAMVSWNTQPAIDTNSAARQWQLSDGGDYDVDIDLTEIVESWLAGAYTNNGLLLRSFDDNGAASPGGWNIRRDTAANRPMLEVVATHVSMNETYQKLDCRTDITVYSAEPCAVNDDQLQVGAAAVGSAVTYLRFEDITVPAGNYVKTAYLHLKGNLDAISGSAQPVAVYACSGDDNWVERPNVANAMTWYARETLAPAGSTPIGSFTWQRGSGSDHWGRTIVLAGNDLANAVVDNGRLTLLLQIDEPVETACYRFASWRDRKGENIMNQNPFGHYGAWLEVITGAEPTCDDLDHPAPPGDLSGDCITDLLDLTTLASTWLQEKP